MTLRELVIRPALGELIDAIHTAMLPSASDADRAERIAAILQPSLGRDDLLTPAQCIPDSSRYRQHLLYCDPAGHFSIVALVWLPGQVTPIHDHVAWCVFGVHQGEEYEIQYEQRATTDGDWLVPIGSTINRTGQVAALVPPGDIHQVSNHGGGLAISIHIYGANLAAQGTSVRRCYNLPILPSSGGGAVSCLSR